MREAVEQHITRRRQAKPNRRQMLLPKPAHRRTQLRYPGGLPGDAALAVAAANLAPLDRAALRAIVTAADVIEVDGQRFLLAPVSDATLDTLAAFEAELEDLEPEPDDDDDDAEEGADREPDDRDLPVPEYGNDHDQTPPVIR